MIQVTPVILCGGSGTRLWPLSRTGFPKQFLCLTGEHSLFQQAAQRLHQLAHDGITLAPPVIVSGEDHRFLAAEQLREIGLPLATALLEPVARNTAPAVTLAALAATADRQDPVLVITPADQTITDPAAYTQAVQQAIAHAAQGHIVILGVTPEKPETGYGYIHAPIHDPERGDQATPHPIPVQAFVEKPDFATAQKYLQEGHYFWNAGIFVLKASTWLQALAQFRPDILHATQAAWQQRSTDTYASATFVRPDKTLFAQVPAESVDYAVLEHGPGSAYQTFQLME